MTPKRIASKGLTLKVIPTHAGWVWKIVTDHNGEAIDFGITADKDSALSAGNRAFYAFLA